MSVTRSERVSCGVCSVVRYPNSACCLLRQGVDLQSVLDDIRKMKIIVKGHERRIKTLEERLAQYEK